MATKDVTVNLPEELCELVERSGEALSLQLKQALVLDLVRQRRISAMRGATLLEMHLTDFVRLMAQHGVPYFNEPPRSPEKLAELFDRAER